MEHLHHVAQHRDREEVGRDQIMVRARVVRRPETGPETAERANE